MNHGLNNALLYTALKTDISFIDVYGKQKDIIATSFIVKNRADEFCLITNRHVLDYPYKFPKNKGCKIENMTLTIKKISEDKYFPDVEIRCNIQNLEDIVYSSNYFNDAACIKKIKAINQSSQKPITDFDFFIPYKLIANEDFINSQLTICDFVAFPGYPPWYDKYNNSPILRTGTISSDPRYDYSLDSFFTGNKIAYEAFSFGGSSGSPIFAIQKGISLGLGLIGDEYREAKLIGINGGHLKDENTYRGHSGISYFFKSSIILDLIDND
jgi:hypothetical protein